MRAFPKGLASPVGSVLVGSEEVVRGARRYRKALGGGWRQAGVLAAAGLLSLRVMRLRLGEDHARLKHLAAELARRLLNRRTCAHYKSCEIFLKYMRKKMS